MGDYRGVRGFTLIEMAITVVVVAILSMVLVTMLGGYIEQARIAQAQSDVRAIGEAILNFERDVGRFPMFRSGGGFLPDSNANVVRLEGPGTAPTTGGSSDWTATSGFADPDCGAGCTFHTMGALISNDIGYPTTSSLGKPFKWKGPYLEVKPDPWGRKYLVNIINAKSSSSSAVVVVSAGADGVLQTFFNPLRTNTSLGGASSDDITFRIR